MTLNTSLKICRTKSHRDLDFYLTKKIELRLFIQTASWYKLINNKGQIK